MTLEGKIGNVVSVIYAIRTFGRHGVPFQSYGVAADQEILRLSAVKMKMPMRLVKQRSTLHASA